MEHAASTEEPPELPRLSEIYDEALPEVYSYVRARCGSRELAEEITSATFLQAAKQWSKGAGPAVSIGWLITVARNKLIDHWRHSSVVERSLTVLEGGISHAEDPWDAVLDWSRSEQILCEIAPHYRAALTLRYLDDLSVKECAELLERSVTSTESLLVRARAAFRNAYDETGGNHE